MKEQCNGCPAMLRDTEKEPCYRCDDRPNTYQKAKELCELIRQEYGVKARLDIRIYRQPKERANEILLHIAQGMGDEIEEFSNESFEGRQWTSLKSRGWGVEVTAHHKEDAQ